MKTKIESRSSWIGKTVVGLTALFVAKSVLRTRRRSPIDGKVVLITGGSRGLGLVVAREFAIHHAHIAICARDEKELESAAVDVRSLGARVETFACDLTNATEIASLIDCVEKAFGQIDILVNNAGTIIVGPVANMTATDFEQAMNLNFWAAVHSTLAVAPKMKIRGGGRIVNIASIGGKVPVPHLAPYCASKFALVGFSSAMRAELAQDKISVTTICPGLMQTGSPRNADFKGKHQAEYAWFSLGDGTPGLSMDAADAARQIVDATIHRDGEVLLGLPAKAASIFYNIAPNVSGSLAAIINRLLPSPVSGQSHIRPGRESESALTRSFLSYFNRKSEQKYNQLRQ